MAVTASSFQTRVLGCSRQGRPIVANIVGAETAVIRIMIVAGQHGDEPLPIKAARQLLTPISPSEEVAVASVPVANPDGLHRKSRYATGIDLNRDHFACQAPETKALHDLLRLFRPTLVIDAHQFKSRRKWMLARGLTHAADVCLDWTTSPIADPGVLSTAEWVGRRTLEVLSEQEWRVSRYLVRSGTGVMRPSSPRLMSLLNYAAVRHGVPSILVEVREPDQRSRHAAERARSAIREAIETCCQIHVATTTRSVRASREITIRGRACKTGAQPKLWTHDSHSGQVCLEPIPGAYRAGWVASKTCRSPLAYGLPAKWTEIAAWLDGHGCEEIQPTKLPAGVLRTAVVTAVFPSRNRDGFARRVDADWRDTRRLGWSASWFRVTDDTARLMTAALEPTSTYGAVRDGLLPWKPAVGSTYPVIRLDRPRG